MGDEFGRRAWSNAPLHGWIRASVGTNASLPPEWTALSHKHEDCWVATPETSRGTLSCLSARVPSHDAVQRNCQVVCSNAAPNRDFLNPAQVEGQRK